MVLWCHQTFSHCIKSLHSLICNAYQNDLKFYFWWKNDQFLVFCNSVSSMWHAKARMCKLISYSHVLQCFTSYNSILLFEFYDDICKSIFAVHHCRWPSGIPGLRVHTDLDIHRIDQTRGAYESTLCMNIHETNVRMMDVKSTSHQANGTIFYFIKYHVTWWPCHNIFIILLILLYNRPFFWQLYEYECIVCHSVCVLFLIKVTSWNIKRF